MISTKIVKNAILVGLVQAHNDTLPAQEGNLSSLAQGAGGSMPMMGAPMLSSGMSNVS
jgi:hypothetical protein